MPDYAKAKIGYEDLFWDTNRNDEVTNRDNSTGGTTAIKHINAKHIPVVSSLSWGSAETVHDFLVLTKAFKDDYDAFYASVSQLENYLGVFADSATLIATHSSPSDDDVFAFVQSTKSFWHWDEDAGPAAWVNYNTQIYDRTNHTGSQAISTITNLQTELDGKADVDGDVLDIDFTPSNYTPNYSGTPGLDNDDLAAHLNGIDANMRKNQWTGSDPTINDDSDDGYSVGSVWFNTSTGEVFKCVDASVGAADWDSFNTTVVETLLHTEEISSSVANVEIDLSSYTSYRKFRIEWDVQCVDNASAYNQLFAELELNGGFKTSSYDSMCLYYSGSAAYQQGNTTKIQLAYNNYGTPEEHFGQMIIDNTDGLLRKWFGSFTGNTNNSISGGHISGVYDGADSTNQLDGIRISATTNLNGGKIRVYGVND